MAVYSYLYCKSSGQSLWLGKRLANGSFWRGDASEQQVSVYAFRFLLAHTSVDLVALDEDDISDDMVSIDDPKEGSLDVRLASIHVDCSCSVQTDLTSYDVVNWLASHYRHIFVCTL